MIPVTPSNEVPADIAFVLVFVMGLSFILFMATFPSSSELPLMKKVLLRGIPATTGALATVLLITSGSSQSPISTPTYKPTSEQVSSFLEDEYGISINDENSLYGELGVDNGFEMAVDGTYQQCKFVSTGVPSSEGYPAAVACSTDASGTWRLLPKQD